MTCSEISLKDWDVNVVGITDVFMSVDNIFNNVNTIKIIPLSLYQDCDTVCCQIKIIINNKEELDVVDIISFDKNGFIKSIKAYKC